LKRSQKQHRNFVERACGSSKKSVFGQKKASFFLDSEANTQEPSNNQPSSSFAVSDDEDEQLPEMFNGGMKKRANNENTDDISSAMSSDQLSQIIKRRRYDQLEAVDVVKDKEEDLPPEIRVIFMRPSHIKTEFLDVPIVDSKAKGAGHQSWRQIREVSGRHSTILYQEGWPCYY
jgi:hypothetical protein